MATERETLMLTPGESVEIVSSEPDALVVEATYAVSNERPPKHMHPEQDESFEVLEGTLLVKVGVALERLDAGDTFEIPAKTRHQMWNGGESEARVRWTTSPAGRTEDWFRALASLQTEGKVDKRGMPAVLSFARLASAYDDTFRLAVGPDLPTRLVIRGLAFVGRLRGA